MFKRNTHHKKLLCVQLQDVSGDVKDTEGSKVEGDNI